MTNFDRIVTVIPAFDRRHKDPSKNYGIHSAELRMVLKGSKGATQFVLYTGWHLKHVREGSFVSDPLPADLGFHSPIPQYTGHEETSIECPYVDGGRCYYDGSSLQADTVFDALVSGGSEAVWEILEGYYHEMFDHQPKVIRCKPKKPKT